MSETTGEGASAVAGDERTGLDAASLAGAVSAHLRYSLGRLPADATAHERYVALALAVRDRLQHRWAHTSEAYLRSGVKVACYLSAEFLLGPHLGNNLVNLGIEEATRDAMATLGRGSRRLCWRRRRSQASATAGWGGWPPAISIRRRRSSGRPSATASVTSSASSTRRFATAGRSRSPTSGCIGAIRGRLPSPKSPTGQLGRPHGARSRRAGPAPRALDPVPGGEGHRLRHADPGLPRPHVQHAAALERGGGRLVRLRGLQHRRLLRGGGRQGRSRRRSARCSIRTTSRRPASVFGSRSSISSCRARCRTCCAC